MELYLTHSHIGEELVFIVQNLPCVISTMEGSEQGAGPNLLRCLPAPNFCESVNPDYSYFSVLMLLQGKMRQSNKRVEGQVTHLNLKLYCKWVCISYNR